MALVTAFVSDASRAVAEMRRVVRAGGFVASYMWDQPAGGAPSEPLFAAIAAIGVQLHLPPSIEACRMLAMRRLWMEASLDRIETRTIEVSRVFADFETYWEVNTAVGVARTTLETLDCSQRDEVRARVREALPLASDGSITLTARANAIKGVVPEPP